MSDGGDVGILNFALTLEYLESTFYKEAKTRAKASGELKSLIDLLADDEQQHVEALTASIKQLGGKPVAEPKFDFPYSDTAGFLKLAQTFEDTGVSAYNGAAPSIKAKEVLGAAGSIVQVEARHAAAIRLQNKQEPAPDAFDPSLERSAGAEGCGTVHRSRRRNREQTGRDERQTREGRAARGRGADAADRGEGPRRLRGLLRPPRRRRLLAGVPDRRRAGGRRRRDPGGLHLDLAQRRALRPGARQRPLLDAQHRPQPGDRRRCAARPGGRRSSTFDDEAILEQRPRASSPTRRRCGGRPRRRCAARSASCPAISRR